MRKITAINALFSPALLVGFAAACMAGPRSATPAARLTPCPLPTHDSLGVRLSYTTYVIDGTRVPGYERYRGGNSHGGAVRLDTLPEVAALKPSDIHDIAVARGPEVERRYGLCPGQAVALITTKAAVAADSAGTRPPNESFKLTGE